ncbi:MAG: DNA methyltransferase [Candidatus Rokubacteria bacterium]|nr:DNA methyltransferase [Candidatus Rokubacteria bacterium]
MTRCESALGRSANGDANKLSPADRPAHDWYRFVLSFPPHLVRDYVERFGIGPRHVVLDPFCGTGTTIVECMKLGTPSVGVEANPMAHFATQVKSDWSPDPDGLLKHAGEIAELVKARLDADGVEDDIPLPLFQTGKKSARLRNQTLRTLPPEKQKLLLTDSISPLPLHKTLVLLECLDEYGDARYRRHELLALAKALVYSISNLHFGPEVGAGPAKKDSPVVPAWLSVIQTMADDLRMLLACGKTPVRIHHADSRQIAKVVDPHSIDAVITSPPYPNEKDYTRTTRLESVLLGFVRSKSDLRALKRGLVRSNTRGVYKDDDDDQWVAENHEVQRIAAVIEKRRIQLGKTSGFERLYHRVAKLYFGGMARHLADLRAILRPGANLAYVVGDQASYLRVMIRTGQLLAEIADSLGYEPVSIDLFRTRLATATKEQLREEVVVLRWPGQKQRWQKASKGGLARSG